jgi:hypothetical protein
MGNLSEKALKIITCLLCIVFIYLTCNNQCNNHYSGGSSQINFLPIPPIQPPGNPSGR